MRYKAVEFISVEPFNGLDIEDNQSWEVWDYVMSIKFCTGGQISINVYPVGWDKTFCLQYLRGFDQIHFFGNKTEPVNNSSTLWLL